MSNKLGEYLRKCRGDMSLREFSTKCGISHTHLDSIEKGADPRTGKPVSISTETLRLIADGIGEDYLVLACLADGVDPNSVENIDPSKYNAAMKIAPINLHLLDRPIPTTGKNGGLTLDGFTYAMYEESKELTEENKKKLMEMAQFFRQQQEKERQN